MPKQSPMQLLSQQVVTRVQHSYDIDGGAMHPVLNVFLLQYFLKAVQRPEWGSKDTPVLQKILPPPEPHERGRGTKQKR